MSYLVLARKYRPSTFAEVVGQEHVTRTLGNAFASGRVHHAFLFCGPRGCGKTTLARIVGKALNCEAPRGAEPCGACSACVSISNGSAVDYQEMDGASNRGIDAIRELTEAVRYQPAVLRKKVYVIDEVHMLTTEAFNALLKTLEEPPPHVTFVLATTEPHKLPNTILSRCQRYDFKLVPASRLGQHLAAIFAKEQLAIEPGAVSLVVRESGGSVRDALSLCDQLISYVGDATMTERHVAEVLGVADRSLTRTLVRALAGGDAGEALGAVESGGSVRDALSLCDQLISYVGEAVMTERHVAEVLGVADRSLTRTLVRALAGGDVGEALAAVESAIERGVDEVQLARAIVRYLRDLSVLQVARDAAGRGLIDATEEELAELSAEAGALERSRVTQMFERMLRCCDELGKTLQPRLVLDCALIDVATVEPLVPLGDLLERLADLEARLAGRPAMRAGAGGGGGSKERPRVPSSAPVPPAGARPAMPPPGRSAMPPAAPPAMPAVPSAVPSVSSTVTSAPSAVPSVSSTVTSAPSAVPSVSSAVPSVSSAAPALAASPVLAPASAPFAPATSPASGPSASAPASAQSAPAAPSALASPSGGGVVEAAAHPVTAISAPVSMQPSGPVPRLESAAAGSGPHGGEPVRSLAIPSGPAEALKAWNDVLSELEAMRKLSLLGPFQHARVMSWTPELLELGFPVDAHSMGEMARDSVDDLRAIVRGLGPAQKAIRVGVRLLDAGESNTAGARSVLETTRERTSAERDRRETEAREHPITKHVLRTFGAQIKEIKTDV